MEQRYILNAIDAALQAGADILSIYNDPASDFEIERKADNSPLTIADRKAHETITGFLCNTPFPILSEEGKHLPYAERSGWDALWIVDPLDGTKEFIKRNGEFTVNIAWVHNSVPVMGVIYLPVKQELYFADEQLQIVRCDFARRCLAGRIDGICYPLADYDRQGPFCDRCFPFASVAGDGGLY